MPKADKSLIGAAGVHFIVSELSLRGLIALPTIRNTAGIDVVVVDKDGTLYANLQVKTSKSKVAFWPIGSRYKEWRGENNWYAFVRYLKNESRFEVFLESAERVAEQVAKNIARDKERGLAEWAPSWFLPKDNAELERVRRQWLELKPCNKRWFDLGGVPLREA
jgi:hypothetical protein